MSEPRHGTPGAYTNHRCRCEDCRRAWAEYMRRYMAARRKEKRR